MKKSTKLMLKIVLVVLASLLIIGGITRHITNNRIDKRVVYWESLIDSEMPAGSSIKLVKQWGKKRNISASIITGNKFQPPEAKQIFYSNVESIPDAGIGFPCSSWNIIIEIYFGQDEKYVGRRVHAVGSCI